MSSWISLLILALVYVSCGRFYVHNLLRARPHQTVVYNVISAWMRMLLVTVLLALPLIFSLYHFIFACLLFMMTVWLTIIFDSKDMHGWF